VGEELTGWSYITDVRTEDLRLSQFTLDIHLELGISSLSDFSSLSR